MTIPTLDDRPTLDAPLPVSSILGEALIACDGDMQAAIVGLVTAAQADDRCRVVQPKRIPEESVGPCWALRPDELRCDRGYHYAGFDVQSRRCPAELVRLWQGKLCKLLGDFGIPATCRGSIAKALRRGWQSWRSTKVQQIDQAAVVPLGRMMDLLGTLVLQIPRRHALLFGDSGTGKSYCLAYLFFSALEQGMNVEWIEDTGMRSLVSALSSFTDTTRFAAEERWRLLAGRQAVFYNDLGVDEDPPRESRPGHPLLGTSLWRLTEHGALTIWATSNLPPSAKEKPRQPGELYVPPDRSLSTHPDVSAKVVMRLLGERVDPVRMAHAQAAADCAEREITREEWAACAAPALLLKFSGENQRFCAGEVSRAAAKLARHIK